jgi:hypothetical protein
VTLELCYPAMRDSACRKGNRRGCRGRNRARPGGVQAPFHCVSPPSDDCLSPQGSIGHGEGRRLSFRVAKKGDRPTNTAPSLKWRGNRARFLTSATLGS